MPQVQFLPAQYVDSSLVVEALACEAEDGSPILLFHPKYGRIEEWLTHLSVTEKIAGSNPVASAKLFRCNSVVE